MRRAAAFERHIDMEQSDLLRCMAGEGVRPAAAMAAEIDQGFQAEPSL
ncbi:hypothetical protein AA0488_2251 [Kozakia baliensis NRIC 0488]|nr:hypothetical protein AA0488_2251 [Kozakia baliensis NRIC 0488]